MKTRHTCTSVLAALALCCTPAFCGSLAAGLAGSYSVTGSNPDGTRYSTGLEVSRTGETYRFVWGSDTVGVGVAVDGQVVVAYGAAACGVVAYRVGKGGDLDGLWATRGSALGSEYASSGAGPYAVAGRNPDGSRYSGTLRVYTVGPAYSLEWLIGKSRYVGLGVRQGGVMGVAYGSDSCGVAVYNVSEGGMLEGDWTAFDVLDRNGKQGVGTETARPR